jgi:hypothetical protein
MNLQQHQQPAVRAPEQLIPWYRQFWPWFIIALPAAAVLASFVSLWLAVSHPDHLVVTEEEYLQLKSELKAQPAVQEQKATEADGSDLKSN